MLQVKLIDLIRIEAVPKGVRHHYMYKVHDDFSAMLIGAEGARLLREYGAGETPEAQVAPRRLPGPLLKRKSTDKD
jgi:hypothetical protein